MTDEFSRPAVAATGPQQAVRIRVSPGNQGVLIEYPDTSAQLVTSDEAQAWGPPDEGVGTGMREVMLKNWRQVWPHVPLADSGDRGRPRVGFAVGDHHAEVGFMVGQFDPTDREDRYRVARMLIDHLAAWADVEVRMDH